MDSMMAFSSIFKKATSLLGLSSSLKPPPLDGEIIYCKNNVCVHPPAPLSLDNQEKHHPGYLTIRSHQDKNCGPTLVLTWIPNSSLKKNPRSIENSPNRSQATTPRISPRRTPKQEYAKSDEPVSTPSDSCVSVGSDFTAEACFSNLLRKKHSLDSVNSELSTESRGESGDGISPTVDSPRKLSNESTARSQADSGIGTYNDDFVQNNEKCVHSSMKNNKLGTNVNDLYTEKLNKINTDIKNLTKAAMEDDNSTSTESDSLTAEEQLAAMLKRNKLRARSRERTDSNRSVSIEMEGDSITVVTEELDSEGMEGGMDKYITDRNINKNESKFDTSSSNSVSTDFEGTSLSSDSTHPSPSGEHYNRMVNEIKENLATNGERSSGQTSSTLTQSSDAITHSSDTVFDHAVHNDLGNTDSHHSSPKVPQSLNLSAINQSSSNSIPTPDISITRQRMSSSSSSTTTSGPDSDPPSPYSSSPTTSPIWGQNIDSPSSIESLSHNLQFPENSLVRRGEREKRSAKEQVCGVFSVDLGQMRSLRVFYSDPDSGIGQIVIASRESQYKILHFHHGGLDKLAEIFEDWSLFAQAHEKQTNEPEKPYKQFMIVKPQLSDDQCHPEEGVFSMVTEDIWRTHMMDDGIIEDDYQLRKAIFFGGLEPSLRHEAWPFLLHYYPFDSTYEEREQTRNDRYIQYQDIRKMREQLTEEEREKFWRNIQCIVEKDVVRTDRSHHYFKGENNPNIEVLKNILLNYAVANPKYGYNQGMSDLLAPILAEVQNEVDTYWCFVGLMQKTIFVSSPKDFDMDKQLLFLRELLRLMQPKFYEHLKNLGQDAMELLFCHRWILLCFKREFPEKDALRIWESCWAHYQTDYFHLFICVAIVSIYGEDVIEQCLPADEILLHFSSMACHMNGQLVLRKARGLLYEYRKREIIPCTLHGLCSLCGQGMWDSGHVPIVECTGDHEDGVCPYQSHPNTPTHHGF